MKTPNRFHWWWLSPLVLLVPFLWDGFREEHWESKKPRLAVLVVFDQMKADYLTRWQDLYDKEGFGRLQAEGAWFQNCHYPYAYTLTAAGHTSLDTGCS